MSDIPKDLLYEFKIAKGRVQEAKAAYEKENALRLVLERAIVRCTGGCEVCQNVHYPPCEPWREEDE